MPPLKEGPSRLLNGLLRRPLALVPQHHLLQHHLLAVTTCSLSQAQLGQGLEHIESEQVPVVGPVGRTARGPVAPHVEGERAKTGQLSGPATGAQHLPWSPVPWTINRGVPWPPKSQQTRRVPSRAVTSSCSMWPAPVMNWPTSQACWRRCPRHWCASNCP